MSTGLIRLNTVLLGFLFLMSSGFESIAQDGTVDISFGNSGFVMPQLANVNVYSSNVVVQSDQKIVTCGTWTNGSVKDFLVMRYNSDGTFDTAFGNDGIVTTDFGNAENEAATYLFLQEDGKILVAGTTGNSPNIHFALARYNIDGSLDSSFHFDGKVVTTIDNYNSIPYSIGIQSDGKIVLAGACIINPNLFRGIAISRYNSDGSLDATFDNDGIVITSIGDFVSANSVVIQTDGKILIGGVQQTESHLYPVLARYTTNGSLDLTFDGDGIVLIDLPGAGGSVFSVGVLPNNKILTVGSNLEVFPGGVNKFAIARFEGNGAFDVSFNSTGYVIQSFVGSSHATAKEFVIQADGKIVVVGNSPNGVLSQITLVRYTDDGLLDLSFGDDGTVITYLPVTANANSIAKQADGKIIVSSNVYDGSTWNSTVIRYNNALTSSISEQSFTQTEILMYPNPTKESITIDLQNSDLSEITIINSSGEIMFKTTIENTVATIDLAHLASGLYFLKLENEKNRRIEKLIKE